MIVSLLLNKIISLFLIMLSGFVLVRCRVLKAEQSRTFTTLSVNILIPCAILSAFQVEWTPDVQQGLLLSLVVSVIINLALILLTLPLKKPLHLDRVEEASIIYSNAGNLIIPLIISILGEDMLIYTSPFMSFQMFLLWSHGRSMLCGEKTISLKKILLNHNMIAIYIGILLLITGLHLPAPVEDAISSLSATVGPMAMLITGMLIGGMDLKAMFLRKRVYLVAVLRLIILPAVILILLRITDVASLVPHGKEILLVPFLSTITPTASTITQMAQLFGHDADYASAINMVTTILCIITMPIMVALYMM